MCHSLLCLLSGLKLTFCKAAFGQDVPMYDSKMYDLLQMGDLTGD